MQRKEWKFLDPPAELVHRLSARLDVSTTLATILVNRGIDTVEAARRFLNPTLDQLYDPFAMLGMERAVEVLADALSRQEGILIFGDYDVDGVTGTALLVSFLRRFSDRISYYIPHRVLEGYGLQSAQIRRFAAEGGKLVLTVDCGISHAAEVEEGRRLGLKFIVTDHHEPPDVLPAADAILNPLQKGCAYPFKQLAGVGIAFKFVQGLARRLGEKGFDAVPEAEVYDYLDLVALGTVADIVPLQDENRIFVKQGLEKLNRSPETGLAALKSAAGLGGRSLKASHIAFALGPRINAAGRLGRADVAVNLLLEHDRELAAGLAEQLNGENRRRQQIEAQILREATDMISSDPSLLDNRVLVLSSPQWHSGVIGIVASKLAERYARPSILIATDSDPGKGSARSVRNFDLFTCLQQSQHLLESFGGHAYAAGLSISHENIPRLRQELNDIHPECERGADLSSALTIDSKLSFGDLRAPLFAELARLMPFGFTNPAPTFATEGVYLSRPPRIVGNNHLRLGLRQKPYVKEAIGFNMGECSASLSKNLAIHIAYSVDLDPHAPGGRHQLRLSDIHFPYTFDPPHAAR